MQYSPFRGRWDSKWWLECKSKSSSQSRNYRLMALFKFSSEKRPRAIVSWFRLGFRFSFRSPFRVSSSTEQAVVVKNIVVVMCLVVVKMCRHTSNIPDRLGSFRLWITSHIQSYSSKEYCRSIFFVVVKMCRHTSHIPDRLSPFNLSIKSHIQCSSSKEYRNIHLFGSSKDV